MDIFLENIDELENLRQQKFRINFIRSPIGVEHNNSKWFKIAEAYRDLTPFARILLALKVFAQTVCTLGIGLFFGSLKEDWSSVFSGKQIESLYAEADLHEKLRLEFIEGQDSDSLVVNEEIRRAKKEKKKDPQYMLDALKTDPNAIEYIHKSLKSDPNFILEAMKMNRHVLNYHTAVSLRKDPIFMLKAIEQDPGALFYAHQSLRDSRTFTLQAMHTNGLALAYAKKNYRRDHSIVMAALTNNGLALKDANLFRKSHSHVLVAVQQNPAAYEFADESLKQDPKILLAAGLKEETLNSEL